MAITDTTGVFTTSHNRRYDLDWLRVIAFFTM